VGPNIELGPPLKAGQTYTLELGSGMIDLNGSPLRERFRKPFLVGDPVREHISVKSSELLPPVTGSRQALMLLFKSPLDWALLLQTITVGSAEGSVIAGQVVLINVKKDGALHPLCVRYSLEDVCGNSITGAFDRPLRKKPQPVIQTNGASLGSN
jgi:hypothetical protein